MNTEERVYVFIERPAWHRVQRIVDRSIDNYFWWRLHNHITDRIRVFHLGELKIIISQKGRFHALLNMSPR